MRNPAEFKAIWAMGETRPKDPMALCFSKERGFFEPVTNRNAEPVMGRIIAWCYRPEDNAGDTPVYNDLVAEGPGSQFVKPDCRVPNWEEIVKAEYGDEPFPKEQLPEDGHRMT